MSQTTPSQDGRTAFEPPRLLHGDCLALLPTIPDNSVDVVITDSPYGTTACDWDTDKLSLEVLWKELHRVAKPFAPFVMFASQPFTTRLIASNIAEFRESLVWIKNKAASGMRATTRHLKVHEDIIVFSRAAHYTYNPQKWRVEDTKMLTHRKTMSSYGDTNHIYGNFKRLRKADPGDRFPISVLSYKIPMTPAKSKEYSPSTDIGYHPTQKPIKLLDYLVRTYSNPGDVVLDPFFGSGTTAVACVHTGRNFVGMELDENYCAIARKRCASASTTALQEELL